MVNASDDILTLGGANPPTGPILTPELAVLLHCLLVIVKQFSFKIFKETFQNNSDIYLDHHLQHFSLVNATENDPDD